MSQDAGLRFSYPTITAGTLCAVISKADNIHQCCHVILLAFHSLPNDVSRTFTSTMSGDKPCWCSAGCIGFSKTSRCDPWHSRFCLIARAYIAGGMIIILIRTCRPILSIRSWYVRIMTRGNWSWVLVVMPSRTLFL